MATTVNDRISATAHGGTFGHEGVSVFIEFDDSGMVVVSTNGTQLKILFDQLSLSVGGFNNSFAIISWRDYGQNVSVTAKAIEVSKSLRGLDKANALSEQISRLDKSIRSAKTTRRSYLGFAIAVPVIVILAITLFLTKSDGLVQWAVDRISIESEQKLGDMLFEQTQGQLKLIHQGPLFEMVEDIGNRLARGSAYQFTWHVADSPTVNAFAMPGGHIVVFTGLISTADTPEELAGVLAHEIQHVVLRHSLKAMVKNIGWRAILSIGLGDVSGTIVGDMAAQLGELKFSRDAETQADKEGLQTLRRAAIDPNGMVTFFEKLAKQDGGTISILSTHPSSSDRMEKLRREIESEPNGIVQPLDYDWTSIRKLASKK